ncbi:NUDIX domain-containing protein [Tateyamaria sp. syn59]|uniref:NUDIX domain-containing protein n=1 Tax=Tateyamaria sp. syn59 TaxID=2576942 RepID=UPI0011BDA76B|nr:NUDIX hydrolase [Tateyamaria sp. syn59]
MARRITGAKLALFVGDRLATMLRDDDPNIKWPNYWDLPGGGWEEGETPLQCALRETREELNLSVAPELVRWGRDYGATSGNITWFFAAHMPEETARDITLGDEGQAWDLMDVQTFLDHDMVVPLFKPRLRDYLAGVMSANFERP